MNFTLWIFSLESFELSSFLRIFSANEMIPLFTRSLRCGLFSARTSSRLDTELIVSVQRVFDDEELRYSPSKSPSLRSISSFSLTPVASISSFVYFETKVGV